MADKTSIEWTDATWNPITGCSVVSPGCTNCYAMRLAGTRLKHHPSREGLTKDTKAGPVWTGEVRFNKEWLEQPLRWTRPRMIFVCAHGDLFAEGVPDEWIDRVFAVMAVAHWHTFQVLTKRPERLRAYFAETWQPAPARSVSIAGDTIHIPAEKHPGDRWGQINAAIDDLKGLDHDRFWTPEGALIGRPAWPRRPLPNVWIGTSIEDQRRADERLPILRETAAAVRWISAEPLLGPTVLDLTGIDWVVVGGESGPGARPMHPDWVRSIRDQCAAAGVAFHFKQWGEWSAILDRDRDDPDWRRDYSHSLNLDRPDIAWLNLAGGIGFHGESFHVLRRVGKKAAGRILDGVTHDAFPEACP